MGNHRLRAFANFVWDVDAQQFHYLPDAVSPLIVHEDTAMRDAIPPAERLAVTVPLLATSILHNYVNVMLTFRLFDCSSIMFALASAIIVYFIRIS